MGVVVRRILLTGATLLAMTAAQPTLAADAPVYKGPAPAAVALFNWSGFYVGVHGGYGWSDTQWTNLAGTHFFNAIGEVDSFRPKGGLYGAQIGYLAQFASVVVGAEISYSGGNLDATVVRPGPFSANTLDTRISELFTATVRLGLPMDRSLLYVKGGYASAKVGIRAGEEPFFAHFLQDSERQHGYLLGVGWDFAVMPNVIFGVEYNYINLGSKDHTGVDNIAFDPFYTIRVNAQIHAIMARLNLKFGG